MFFEGASHDDNVIKINQAGLIRKSSEDCFHKTLECFRSSEERSWLLHFRSTQVTGAHAAITSPFCIFLVLSLMLAILTGMTEFEKSTTDEAISTPAFKLSGSG
ncbi:hypothetical protein TNCV_1059241 [Trichonephila clavipes]|nr:hypothetical protein TNCV_1059241 [Trichonephila clavipes]